MTIEKSVKPVSLTKKASLNALASTLDYGARLVVGFITNPLLVSGLGDYSYGVWQILGRLIGYISPASGRPTQVLKWTVANQQSSTDYDQKRRQVGSAIAVWLLFLPLMTLLGSLLAWFAPIWLKAPTNYYLSIRCAAALLVVNLVMVSLVHIPQAVLLGENLGYKRMGLSALLVFIGGGLTILALYFNTSIVGVAAATLTTTLLTGALFWQVTHAYVPWFGVAKPLYQAIRQFLGLSSWFLVWNLIVKLMRASDVVILGILDSPELVTVYSITKYAPETVISLVIIVVVGICPGLGGIIGSGNLRKASQVRNEIMLFTWLLATILGSTILLWNQSFLGLWVGSEYSVGSWATLMIVVMVTQFVFIQNDASIIDLTLNLRNKVLIGFLSANLSIAIAAALVVYGQMGIVGLCLGFILGRLMLSLAYPWLIGRFLGISLLGQFTSIFRPTLVICCLFGLMLVLSQFLQVNNWLTLIFSVGITLVIMSIVAFYLGLSGSQRQRIKERTQNLFPALR